MSWAEIARGQLQAIYLQYESRNATLDACKTQEEKDKWLDRWSQEDAAENIASAIRSVNIRRGLF